MLMLLLCVVVVVTYAWEDNDEVEGENTERERESFREKSHSASRRLRVIQNMIVDDEMKVSEGYVEEIVNWFGKAMGQVVTSYGTVRFKWRSMKEVVLS